MACLALASPAAHRNRYALFPASTKPPETYTHLLASASHSRHGCDAAGTHVVINGRVIHGCRCGIEFRRGWAIHVHCRSSARAIPEFVRDVPSAGQLSAVPETNQSYDSSGWGSLYAISMTEGAA